MALDGWRRPFQTCNLHQCALAVHVVGYELAHGVAYGIVVGAHVGGIFVAVGAAVEEYHGYAAVVCLVDYGCEAGCRIRGYDEQIHPLVDEMVYLFYLAPVAVVCREKLKFHGVVHISSRHKLAVLLVAPYILAALRHAYAPLLVAFST